MIQFLADNLDQLDLALDQLAICDRNFDRFALMLIDNVVELTLHKIAQDKASQNEMWGRFEPPKYDPKIIEKALGQNFDSKVKAAHKFDIIDVRLTESLLNLHSFRNTAYHKGLRHEKILHSVSLFYFQCTCELLKQHRPTWWSWSSSDRISHRAMKYLGTYTLGNAEKIFNDAYNRLLEISISMPQNFVEDLAGDMSDTIEATDESIDFLATEGPEKRERNEVIVDVQAWSFAFTEEGKLFAKENGCQEASPLGYVEWLSRNYHWQTKADPVPGWRTRLESLSKEENPHMALKKYCDFMRQTESFRSLITEAAIQLDTHIQQQIDMARGK